ncbi:MAG: LacI family DNA-binding transcriptional regulator, partial [Anaerolineae bacterium]|nr:LacI family DNA-binding transcriptional regulator [Anaerolineae bacterium]
MAETTIYDVAERAGVAISTVSKVLSGRHAVSARTRQRVLQAAADLHYMPYLGARSLAGERMRLIGVVLTADALSQVIAIERAFA